MQRNYVNMRLIYVDMHHKTEVPSNEGVIFRTRDFCVSRRKRCASVATVGTEFDVVCTSLQCRISVVAGMYGF